MMNKLSRRDNPWAKIPNCDVEAFLIVMIILVVVFGFFEEGCKVVLPVSATGSDCVDFALRFPGAKGGQADSELLGNF